MKPPVSSNYTGFFAGNQMRLFAIIRFSGRANVLFLVHLIYGPTVYCSRAKCLAGVKLISSFRTSVQGGRLLPTASTCKLTTYRWAWAYGGTRCLSRCPDGRLAWRPRLTTCASNRVIYYDYNHVPKTATACVLPIIESHTWGSTTRNPKGY